MFREFYVEPEISSLIDSHKITSKPVIQYYRQQLDFDDLVPHLINSFELTLLDFGLMHQIGLNFIVSNVDAPLPWLLKQYSVGNS